MDDFEIEWRGDPPNEPEKTVLERMVNLVYYNGCGCFLASAFILTPIVAIIIVLFNR